MTAISIADVMPKGLTKAQKSAFRRVCDMRNAEGDPVSAIEVDAVVDYVDARARLAALQKIARREHRDNPLVLNYILPVEGAVERAAATCRRLGRDLRLTSSAPGAKR